ncbi:MAG: M56 family metallopeptidase [Bacillota bacterium]|nr:M56 family metallopeptidase [Bacillota bacterium]
MNDVFNAVFYSVLGLSISASMMAGVVFVLRAVLKKKHGVSRAAFVFLWLFVFVRACLPFGFETDLGWAESPLPEQSIYGAVYSQVFDGHAAAPAPETGAGARDFRTEETPEPETGGSPASAPGEAAASYVDLMNLIPGLWAAGAAFFIIFFAAAYIKKILQIRKLPHFAPDSEMIQIFERLKAETGAKKAELRRGSDPGGAVYGMFRPVAAIGEENTDIAEMIILHELVHIKRKDNLKKAFAHLALAVHWFNPVMWTAVRFMCRDIEMACDEKAVRVLGAEGRKQYAGIILRCARVYSGNPAASYFGESPVYERIKHIMAGGKHPAGIPLICLAVSAFLVMGCFAAPASAFSEKTVLSKTEEVRSAFQEFQVPEADMYSVIDYAVISDGAVFVIDKENENMYTFCVMNSDGDAEAQYDVPKTGWIYTGSMYSDDDAVYFAADSGERVSVRCFDPKTGRISEAAYAGGSENPVKLFGGDGYLCWYEGQVLKVFDLSAGKTSAEYLTAGNQDYGAVLDGWISYQYINPESGKAAVRTVNFESGQYYEAESLLGENTYSVYGNEKYTVYKEDFGSTAAEESGETGYPEVYIYDAEKTATFSLWDIVPEEFADKLRPKLWGINLLGNSLIICGEGNSVYTVNLENGNTEELISGNEGIGYYTFRNSGKTVTTMLYAAENGSAVGTGNIYIARLVSEV